MGESVLFNGTIYTNVTCLQMWFINLTLYKDTTCIMLPGRKHIAQQSKTVDR